MIIGRWSQVDGRRLSQLLRRWKPETRPRDYNREGMISVLQLGTLSYAEGLRLQQKLVDLRKSGQIGDVLLLLEHTPVITLGRNAKAANVLVSAEALAARGVEVFECDRGGDVTFHGPGQLVGYPILDLRGFPRRQSPQPCHPERSEVHEVNSAESKDPYLSPGPASAQTAVNSACSSVRKTLGVVDYVRCLEEVLIRTCAEFGIPTKRVPGLTGVWTETEPSAKIAAIGVHISRSVTSHGFALNVNTDLSYFNLIVPCGITAKPVTSMQGELGREIDASQVAQSLARNFGVVFGRETVWIDTLDALLAQTIGVPMKAPKPFRQLHGEDEILFT
jgi:lipoyl(octanoyl) transferase